MEAGNITKAATFKSFLQLIFVRVIFNIFMRQTLTDDFLGGERRLHKNMNCAFSLTQLKLTHINYN